MESIDLRFPLIPEATDSGRAFLAMLKDWFGYDALLDGDQWVVRTTEPEILKSLKDTLSVGSPIDLVTTPPSSTAEQLFESIPPDFLRFPFTPSQPVRLFSGYGLSGELEQIHVKLLLAKRKSAKIKLVSDELIPLMRDKLGATKCLPIAVDPNVFQQNASFSKIMLLVQRHGFPEAQRLVQQQNVMESILPSALDALEFLNPFIILPPRAVSLPISFLGVSWCFIKDTDWYFPLPAVENLFHHFRSSSSPRVSAQSPGLFGSASGFAEKDAVDYLQMLSDGVNRLLKFIHNPLTFRQASGFVDFYRQIQALSAVGLIFADLKALTVSTYGHMRVVHSMAVIDKIANLQKFVGGSQASEPEIFEFLVGISQRRKINGIIRASIPHHMQRLRDILIEATRAFTTTHLHLRRELAGGGGSGYTRSKRLRAHRNLGHGAFLLKDQFDKLFLDSPCELPQDFPSIALVLALAMMLSPRDFLTV